MEQKTLEQCKQIFAKNEEACDKIMDVTSMLANRTRLRILCLLNEGDFCVGDIVEATGGQMSNVSQQLKLLTLGGYVEKTRDKRNVIYAVRDKKLKEVIGFLQKQYRS